MDFVQYPNLDPTTLQQKYSYNIDNKYLIVFA